MAYNLAMHMALKPPVTRTTGPHAAGHVSATRAAGVKALFFVVLAIASITVWGEHRGDREPPGTVPSGAGDKAAIRAIFAQDSQLGAVRNHASEEAPIASGIRDYVDGLDRLDFSACPVDFTRAFRRHRDAWAESIGFFEQFEGLRGELHELWDLIDQQGDAEQRAALGAIQQAITVTWTEVEALAQSHGVTPGE